MEDVKQEQKEEVAFSPKIPSDDYLGITSQNEVENEALDIKVKQEVPNVKIKQDVPKVKIKKEIPYVKIEKEEPEVEIKKEESKVKIKKEEPPTSLKREPDPEFDEILSSARPGKVLRRKRIEYVDLTES